jgi:hypothetical protein
MDEAMSHAKGPGQIAITLVYSRHVGGKYVHGGLTLRFDSLRPYAFVSHAQWPRTDNYESSIRDAVEQTLLQLQAHKDSTVVVLKHIEWDDVGSCELGFRRAAVAAVRAAFEV